MTDKTNKLITASIMFSLMVTGSYGSPADKPAVAQIIARNESVSIDKIYETEEWGKIVKKWDEMDLVKVKNFEDISNKVEEEKKNIGELYKNLIKKGYLSEISAEALNLVYGENLRSTLEGKVELPCCYEPMMIQEWDCTGVDTREELNKKLYLVEELYKKGTVKKEVLDKAKKDIADRISLLDKADKYWQSKGKGHEKEIDVILHLYDMNAGGIKDGKPVEKDIFKASEYIVKLEAERR
ncbi:MAG: hypothetical protein ABRQ38_28185 [Candidatus Eremiobacterota bacterium]